jgi:hypothetical protein
MREHRDWKSDQTDHRRKPQRTPGHVDTSNPPELTDKRQSSAAKICQGMSARRREGQTAHPTRKARPTGVMAPRLDIPVRAGHRDSEKAPPVKDHPATRAAAVAAREMTAAVMSSRTRGHLIAHGRLKTASMSGDKRLRKPWRKCPAATPRSPPASEEHERIAIAPSRTKHSGMRCRVI